MIALLGGTFDPIHFGHLQPAVEIAERLCVSELRFVPCHQPPHRAQPQVTSSQRLHMVRLAIEDMPLFTADDRELQHDKPSYTVDTLFSVREEIGYHVPLVFIMGMDAFQSFASWHRWRDILELAHIAVTSRPNYTMPIPDWAEKRVTKQLMPLREKSSGHIIICEVTALAISASMIRQRIADGYLVNYLLPEKVNRYITEHRLYR